MKYRIKGPGTLSPGDPRNGRTCHSTVLDPGHGSPLLPPPDCPAGHKTGIVSPLVCRPATPRRALVTNFISRESRQAYPIAAYWIWREEVACLPPPAR